MKKQLLKLMSLVVAVVIVATQAQGQVYDLLPDISPSPFRIKVSTFASGLPVESEKVTEVFTQRVGPTDLAVVPNGSGDLIVATYGGNAYRIDHLGSINETPFLQLGVQGSTSYSPQFDIGGAHGFTSIVFHPSFDSDQHAGRGKFYTIESELTASGVPDFELSTKTGRHHDDAVYEYTLPNPADLVCGSQCVASKREVLRVLQPGWHHNLTDLEFGADDLLFIASADGSTSQTTAPFMSDNSQALDTVFGNILRINPLGSNSKNGEYGIPASNPFIDRDDALPEIFAYGFRNPYRINFDSQTGKLYTVDTGETRIESAYEVFPGGNHGWNMKQGSFLYDKTTKMVSPDLDLDHSGLGDVAEEHSLIEPIFEYDRDFGRAIIGTVLYHGQSVPHLDNSFVFGDFDGRLYYGDMATGDEYEFTLTDDSDPLPFQIHSINEDQNGDIYTLGIRRVPGGFDGVVVKLESCLGVANPGDFDRNGTVDFDDFLVLSTNFGLSGSSIAQGDANCDGHVEFSDFLLLSTNFGNSPIASVPEPANSMLWSLFLSLLYRRQRRSYA